MSDDQNPEREAWEHRDDEDEWSEAPEDVQVTSSPAQVVSFRLPVEELAKMTEEAERAGETISEYIRTALAVRMFGTPVGPSVEVTTGASKLVLRSLIVVDRQTENAPGLIPDYPPRFSSLGG